MIAYIYIGNICELPKVNVNKNNWKYNRRFKCSKV